MKQEYLSLKKNNLIDRTSFFFISLNDQRLIVPRKKNEKKIIV